MKLTLLSLIVALLFACKGNENHVSFSIDGKEVVFPADSCQIFSMSGKRFGLTCTNQKTHDGVLILTESKPFDGIYTFDTTDATSLIKFATIVVNFGNSVYHPEYNQDNRFVVTSKGENKFDVKGLCYLKSGSRIAICNINLLNSPYKADLPDVLLELNQ